MSVSTPTQGASDFEIVARGGAEFDARLRRFNEMKAHGEHSVKLRKEAEQILEQAKAQAKALLAQAEHDAADAKARNEWAAKYCEALEAWDADLKVLDADIKAWLKTMPA
jgi:hypothetical protein